MILDVGKKYNKRTLFRMRQFYKIFSDQKVSTLMTELSWSHYLQLLTINNFEQIYYYIKISIHQKLSVRELQNKIKSNEYERLSVETKNKLITKEETKINDLIKNPIIIKNTSNDEIITEKLLKQRILEDLDNFLEQLGDGFTYIKN